MKKSIILTEGEKKEILNLHISKGYKTLNLDSYITNLLKESYTKSNIIAVQNALIAAGENVGPTGADGDYGTNTRNAVKNFQKKNGLVNDGVVGPCTAKALGVKSLQGGDVCQDTNVKQKVSNNKKNEVKKDEKNKESLGGDDVYDCIGIDKAVCDRLNKNGGDIGQGKNEGCAEYMRICLSQIDNEIGRGHAWKLLPILKKSSGQEIYNMFTSSDINYSKIASSFSDIKNMKKQCEVHRTGKDKDLIDDTFAKKVPSFYPKSTSLNKSLLKKGDIVGMYWATSHNFGQAFCTRAVDEQTGALNSKGPYSFNTHVGFVGAIKDGEPLIFHSVGGQRKATPVSKLMNKSGQGMIVWAWRDDDIYYSIYPKEEPWYRDITKYF